LASAPVLTEAGPFTISENELVIVTAAAPLFDGSATLMAVSATPGGAVIIWGAV
jgi:hypothetical protein